MKKKKSKLSLFFILIFLVVMNTMACSNLAEKKTLSKEYIEDLQAKHYYAKLVNIAYDWPTEPSSMEEALNGDNFERIWGKTHVLVLNGQFYQLIDDKKIYVNIEEGQYSEDVNWRIGYNIDISKIEYLDNGEEEIEWPIGESKTYYFEEFGYIAKDIEEDTDNEYTVRTLRFYYDNEKLYAIKDSISEYSFFHIETWSDTIPEHMTFEIPSDYQKFEINT